MRGASCHPPKLVDLDLDRGSASPRPSRLRPSRAVPSMSGRRSARPAMTARSMGHQTTLWLHSRHAGAYASLATPEARAIAAISGVPIEPQKSPLCLGCHATAAEAEGWERDETFSIRDGVQCEKCHGPGSEHVDSWSAPNDPKSGPKVRLASPIGTDCMKCHKEKPSHTRSLAQAAASAGPADRAVPACPGPARAGPSNPQGLEARGERPSRAPDRCPSDGKVHRVARLRRVSRCARERAFSSAAGEARSMRRPTRHWAPPRPVRSPRRWASRATRRPARPA